jgi:hypothetical protein
LKTPAKISPDILTNRPESRSNPVYGRGQIHSSEIKSHSLPLTSSLPHRGLALVGKNGGDHLFIRRLATEFAASALVSGTIPHFFKILLFRFVTVGFD